MSTCESPDCNKPASVSRHLAASKLHGKGRILLCRQCAGSDAGHDPKFCGEFGCAGAEKATTDESAIEMPRPLAVDKAVDHPSHYGGKDDPYEAIKIIEAWRLGFNLGNTIKYIRRAGAKGPTVQDLKKAAWYLNREIERLET